MSYVHGDVQLTGRNVVLIDTLLNAVAITDTNFHFSQIIDISGYENLTLFIDNSLGVSMTGRFYTGTQGNYILAKSDGTDADITISNTLVNRYEIFNGNDNTTLKSSYMNLKFGVFASAAPTSGSITVMLYGTKR